jgi:hypothetical protein
MFARKVIALAFLVAVGANSATAEPIAPLQPGEAFAIMPDGTMSRITITNPQQLEGFKANAKRIDHCSMFMVDSLGFVTLVNTNPHTSMITCENVFKLQ